MDTGSNGRTKEILYRYTDKLYDFPWIDDFYAARNYSFSFATQDYILWLDADDVIMEHHRKSFETLKKNIAHNVDVVSMHYHLEHDENGQVVLSLRRNRLVKRSMNFKWIGAVHEYLEVSGFILNSNIAVTHCNIRHDPDRNLRIYQGRIANGEIFSTRDLYYYANELKDMANMKKR